MELEEQMGALNLDNNIQPWQGRNKIREGAQHRQQHRSWLGLYPQQIRNPNRQRPQQQRINVSRNINLQLLEDNMQRFIFGATRQSRGNRRFRGHHCLRQSRLFALCGELVSHVPTITTNLNRSPEDYQTPIRTVTATASAHPSQPQLDQRFPTSSTGKNDSHCSLYRD